MPIQIDLGTSSPSNTTQPSRRSTGPIVGIDLGTTNSLVAFADSSGTKVLGGEKRLLRSRVAIRANGSLETVDEKWAPANKELVLTSVKRLMGRSLEDLSNQKSELSFELQDDELHSQVRIVAPNGALISPIEVSAQILRTLKNIAQDDLGQSVDRCVITVPAYFDDAQRSATRAAARIAGWDVVRVLNEPTAAALAFGWSHEKPGTVAVFDLGGGTFDVSVLRLSHQVIEVLATAGDTALGGDDMDRALLNLAWTKAQKAPSADWSTQPKSELRALWTEAERVKRDLSTKESAEFLFPWGERAVLSRAEVESTWEALLGRALQCCARALQDAKLAVEDLDDVLLVGGSTRVPYVRHRVQEFFKRAPNASLHPDEAVALGASLQAKVLSGASDAQLLLDVIPLSLGLETMGGAVSKLIPRNSTIPTEAREVFTNHAENQTAFDLHVVQGERELTKDCRSLARFRLRGLAPAPAGYHRVEVLYRVDANGILNVRAKDLRTGKAHEVEIRPSFGMSEEEVFRLLEESELKAEEDMQSRQLIDARTEAETVIHATEKMLASSGSMATPVERAQIEARLVDLKNTTKGSDVSAIQNAISELDAAGRDLAETQVNAALDRALAGSSADNLLHGSKRGL